MSIQRSKLILVDDMKANLTMGKDLLKFFYEVFLASSAMKLFEILENVIPDLILLDIVMPDMNGYEVIRKLKKDSRYSDIPVIFLTSKDDDSSEMEGFDLGAVDYITKPFSGPLLLKRIENQLAFVQQKKDLLKTQAELEKYTDSLEMKVHEKTAIVAELQNAVLTTVAELVEFRDEKTGGHITRTQHYLQVLVNGMISEGVYVDEVSNWIMDFFLLSAQLHDVGKIAITDTILNKPDKLTFEEFEIMKTHVTVGVDAIEQIMKNTKEHVFLDHALLIAGTHHEKWDGSGYPLGLKGKNIPLEGRLMAIADVYDALVSERPYKKAFSHEDAFKIITDGDGSHFDPLLISVFKKVAHLFSEGN